MILLTGSGPQNRNEELFGHKPFMVLADYLTRRGIAVLRSDDRGVGGTSGDFVAATTEDFTEDAMAGVAFLQTRPEVNLDLIGLAGHSEGGMMAPMAAAWSESVKFIVLLAAPAIPFEEILLYQKLRLWENAGMNSEMIALQTKWHRKLITLISRELSDLQVKEEVARMFDELPEEEHAMLQRTKISVQPEIDALIAPWWRFAARYDAISTLKKVKCPVLAINGERDTQVTAEENLAVIEKSLREGMCKNYTVKSMEGLNHMFQTAETGDESEYVKIEESFSPKAMKLIAEWIKGLEN